jgi:hypothetical protein
MTQRDNMLRCIRFEKPEYIPMTYCVSGACWNYYSHDALFELFEGHPRLFPGYRRPEGEIKPVFSGDSDSAELYTDEFGCVWRTVIDGIRGTVIRHPLDVWDNFDKYTMPALPEIDVEAGRAQVEAQKAAGVFTASGLPHGHTFLRLQDIRGYENLLCDMQDDDPRLWRLIGMLEDYNYHFVSRWSQMGYDQIGYAEDLGMQVGPMLPPAMFRRFILPSYRRLMKPARNSGAIIHMHSDGDIRTLADDLVEGGVDVLNCQDLVCGIDWIARRFAGLVAIDLDIDRQKITFGGTPGEVDSLILREVKALSSPAGGLSMIYGLYPGIPVKNFLALADAMERYMGYWS